LFLVDDAAASEFLEDAHELHPGAKRVLLVDRARDVEEVVAAAALFIMIGGEPHTHWLADEIARDAQGYVVTGRDVLEQPGVRWEHHRDPLLLETSLPGVFAAGDLRQGSIKRVASAVGDGATAVRLVHEHLRADHSERALG
jgi:thioredoxin reductase (NADPH)